MTPHYDLRSPVLRRFRGDTHPERFTVTDAQGLPVDLTGAEVTFTAKRHAHEEAPVLERSSSDPTEVELTSPTEGEVTVLFSSAEMAALEPRTYLYDLQVVLADGVVHTVAAGELVISADITA